MGDNVWVDRVLLKTVCIDVKIMLSYLKNKETNQMNDTELEAYTVNIQELTNLVTR